MSREKMSLTRIKYLILMILQANISVGIVGGISTSILYAFSSFSLQPSVVCFNRLISCIFSSFPKDMPVYLTNWTNGNSVSESLNFKNISNQKNSLESIVLLMRQLQHHFDCLHWFPNWPFDVADIRQQVPKRQSWVYLRVKTTCRKEPVLFQFCHEAVAVEYTRMHDKMITWSLSTKQQYG